MTQYLRLTVIGARRKADLVLPEDVPVHELLPEIIDLLDEPPASSPLALTTLLGVRADDALSFADQGIDNGHVLRLLPADFAPLPPEVAEVTEAVADANVTRADRWSPRLTAISQAVALGLATAITAVLLPLTPVAALVTLALTFATAIVIGATASRRANSAHAAAFFAVAAGVAPALSTHALSLWIDASLLVVVAATWALVWIAAAVIWGIGGRRRSVLLGAAIALVTTVAIITCVNLATPPLVVAAVGGIAAAVILGLIPSFALTAAGVARLDDATSEAGPVRRADVSTAIVEAFASQTSLVLSVAPPLGACIAVLASGTPWSLGLACALVVFVLTRSRLFPLAVARITLFIAAAVPAALWLISNGDVSGSMRAAIAGACMIALLIAVVVPHTPATTARVRRWLGFFEALSLIVVIPLLLGILGVFQDILGAFR